MRLRCTMFSWPMAANTPAVTRSESPGRKKPMSRPVSAKTMVVMAVRPPTRTSVSTSVSWCKMCLNHSMRLRDGSRLRVGSAPMPEYTDEHAKAGIDAPLPALETWPNQYPDYEIAVEIPEYNAICPKTGLPDFGHLTIRYVPDRLCLELKSLKLYVVAYRNVGIFYENAVNRILEDCVAACRPKRMTITGTFSSRGGISSTIEARYPR